MKFTVFAKYQGKTVVHWPLLALFVLMAGIAGAMACLLLIVTSDNLGLPLDIFDYSPVLLAGSAILFMAIAVLISFWKRRRTTVHQLQELEAPPNPLFSLTAASFKRTLGRLLFVSLCLATLVALFYTVENWRGKRAFRKYKRQLEAKGEILDWKSVLPPPVPDSQNLAEAPLFKGLLDYERGPRGVIWRNTNDTARLELLARIVSWGVHTKSSHSENLQKNELMDLRGYQEYFLLNTNVLHASSPQTPLQDISLALSPFEADLNQLKSAAATHPLSRFPVHYEDSIGCLLPHLAKLKTLEQYLKLHAAVLLESGRREEAFGDLQLMFQLADAVRDEPLMISHLVRVACLGISIQVVKEGFVRHSWNNEQLVWIQNRCAGINLVRDAEKCVNGERAMGLECIDMVRRGALPYNALFGEDERSRTDVYLRHALYKLTPSGWYYQNMLSLCQYHERLLRTIVDSSVPQVHPHEAEVLDDEMAHRSRTPFNLLARLLSPSMTTYWTRTSRWQTALQHGTIACALERHRLKTGSYPEALQSLAPQFLEKLPRDVITGEAHKYHRTEDGSYLLYSIGWNEKDDGGTVATLSGPGVDQKKGDWVWSLVPTERLNPR